MAAGGAELAHAVIHPRDLGYVSASIHLRTLRASLVCVHLCIASTMRGLGLAPKANEILNIKNVSGLGEANVVVRLMVYCARRHNTGPCVLMLVRPSLRSRARLTHDRRAQPAWPPQAWPRSRTTQHTRRATNCWRRLDRHLISHGLDGVGCVVAFGRIGGSLRWVKLDAEGCSRL